MGVPQSKGHTMIHPGAENRAGVLFEHDQRNGGEDSRLGDFSWRITWP